MTRRRGAAARQMRAALAEPDDVFREAQQPVPRGRLARRVARVERARAGLVHPAAPVLAREAGLAAALQIQCSAGHRKLVRGLVLANVDPQEIAALSGFPAGVIRLYERVFWNVRSRLRSAVRVGLWLEALPALEAAPLRIAYAGGSGPFLEFLRGGEMSAATRALLGRLTQHAVLRQACLAGMLPFRAAAAARYVRNWIALLKHERSVAMQKLRRARALEKIKAARAKLRLERGAHEERERQLAEREKALEAREARLAAQRAQLQAAAARTAERPVVCPHLAALRSAEADQPPVTLHVRRAAEA